MVLYSDYNTLHHYYYVEKEYVILSKNSKQIKVEYLS
jgi:hypothetical protein